MGTNGAHLTRGQGWVLALTGAALGERLGRCRMLAIPGRRPAAPLVPVQTDTPKIEIRS